MSKPNSTTKAPTIPPIKAIEFAGDIVATSTVVCVGIVDDNDINIDSLLTLCKEVVDEITAVTVSYFVVVVNTEVATIDVDDNDVGHTELVF